ncbi:MAG TPA: GIY-YIG nuclease family protein [Terriglobia bacterium]|nr:GIY-YIG nuclease family protein [Terriglobia bacterium]
MRTKTYYVYIMAGKSRTLYTGVTNSLEVRVGQHRNKLHKGFTARYNINRLVFFEVFHDVLDAIAREKQIKGWGRMKKIALIESKNRDWKDLSDGWPGSPAAKPAGDKQTVRDPSVAAATSE